MAGKGKIDLNRASKEELTQLEGIGPSTAQGIVNYREQHGGFKNIEELDNVGGISRTMLDKVRPNVEISGTSGSHSRLQKSKK
jgi:competence protein ComEA